MENGFRRKSTAPLWMASSAFITLAKPSWMKEPESVVTFTPVGALAEAPVPTPDGFALVATDEILPAPADLDPTAVRRELREALGEALLQGYEQALRRRYAVEIDERVLARVVESFAR